MRGKKWSEQELDYLRASEGTRSWNAVARELGRWPGSVIVKARQLGLQSGPSGFQSGDTNPGYIDGITSRGGRSRVVTGTGCSHRTNDCPHHWSESELDHLRQMVETGVPPTRISQMLGRPLSSCNSKAAELGVVFSSSIQLWTSEEDEYLKDNFLSLSHRELAEHLGRSWQAVGVRARKLGITREDLKGSNSPLWRGGGPRIYSDHEWVTKIRPAVLRRDRDVCRECGGTYRLVVHHIIPRRLSSDNSMSNLVTLCFPHHRQQKAHYWVEIPEDISVHLPGYQFEQLMLGGTQ